MVSASSKQDSQIWFWVASALLLSTFLGDLLICPHSKVEESFQLQATHDLFYHGIMPAVRSFVVGENNVTLPYDHLRYPGGTLLQLAKDSILLQSPWFSLLCSISRSSNIYWSNHLDIPMSFNSNDTTASGGYCRSRPNIYPVPRSIISLASQCTWLDSSRQIDGPSIQPTEHWSMVLDNHCLSIPHAFLRESHAPQCLCASSCFTFVQFLDPRKYQMGSCRVGLWDCCLSM
jgi:hypothetical protein